MAGKEGVDSVISRIDDLGGRVATAKNLSDVQELVGRMATSKAIVELQETLTKISADLKAVRTEMADLRESQEKALRKLREEVLEAVENVEAGDSEVAEETNELLKNTLGEAKALFSHLFGDEEVLKAARGRIRKWILSEKGGKLPAGGGSDD